MKDMPLTFVDVETTGTSAEKNRVIEIGIVRVHDGEIVEKYNSLINPNVRIPSFITRLTGISHNHLKGAPRFEDVAEEVGFFFDETTMVAHNAPFDYRFLHQEYKRLGQLFTPQQLCTVKLSRMLFPQYNRHGLDHVMKRFNITVKNRHRALDDAIATWKFFQHIQRSFEEEEVSKTVKSLVMQP